MKSGSLMLFGSRARGDASAESDVDLLLLSDRSRCRLVSRGRVNLSIYTPEFLLDLCRSGSLFAWHLRREGRPIRDHGGRLRTILEEFRPRRSYARERREASLVGWCLSSPDARTADPRIVRACMLFALRTVVYSVLAERGEIKFSRAGVFAVLRDSRVDRLWKLKSAESLPDFAVLEFERILMTYAGPPPPWAGAPWQRISDHPNLPRLVSKKLSELRGQRQALDSYAWCPRPAEPFDVSALRLF